MVERLNKNQRWLLKEMNRTPDASFIFTGRLSRKWGKRVYQSAYTDRLVVRMYGSPQVFLRQRGFIEYETPDHQTYVLTNKGRKYG